MQESSLEWWTVSGFISSHGFYTTLTALCAVETSVDEYIRWEAYWMVDHEYCCQMSCKFTQDGWRVDGSPGQRTTMDRVS